ncbi:MAG: exopolysaccharide biosynthesis polyprenyl glycosylphosphotransferase [bacterium]|nr:exopolysaccharide biosynthesis polyprenyl glycosylphosphotransferase [bacterium]
MVYKAKQAILILGDIFFLYFSLFLAIFIRYGLIGKIQLRAHLLPFSIVFIAWLIIFYVVGLFDIRNLKINVFFIRRFLTGLTLGVIASMALFYLVPSFRISPKTNLLIFAVIFSAFDFLWRWILGRMVKSPSKTVLLIGNNLNTNELKVYLSANPQIGYKIQSHLSREEISDHDDLSVLIKNEKITTIVLSGRLSQEIFLSKLIFKNISLGIEVMNFNDFYENVFGKIPLSELEEAWFLENITKRRKAYKFLKRVVDIIISLIGLIITLPFYPFIALAIRLNSKGSIIYKQTRIGEKGKTYTNYKFRSMIAGPTQSWHAKNDKRITGVGKFLRRTHLDELPQLINVLKGEMSFIGPRPDFVDFYENLNQTIPYYNIRTLVRPGITGWAQVNYPITLSLEETRERLAYDFYYLKNYSLILDLLIILKTVKAVLTASGA